MTKLICAGFAAVVSMGAASAVRSTLQAICMRIADLVMCLAGRDAVE